MVQSHFDHLADEYDNVFHPHVSGHYLEKRVRLIKSLKTGPKVLDFGCGTGVLAARLRQEGFEAHGTDYSAGMLAKARERGVIGEVCSNGEIPFSSDKFDLTYSVAVFHHLETRDNVVKAIHEMARVTKKGGKILIWDHNPLNPYWKFLMPRLPQDHGDERLVPLGELVSGLALAGAEDIEWRRLGWVPEFAPRFSMPFVRLVEKTLEALPLVKNISAHNVVVATKR